jgi:GH15 family glucan-1,4-alpha-glucosidase
VSFLSLRDYGVIGNQASAALVSRDGSVDWCCLPWLDSPSHFGALLDSNHAGQFSIHPEGDFHSRQAYVGFTNVLETHFETPNGRGVVTDWMPVTDMPEREPVIRRRVRTLDGEVKWKATCSPRFEYASESALAERWRDGVLFRGTQPGNLGFLRSSLPIAISADGRTANCEFELEPSECADFSWAWGRHGGLEVFAPPEETISHWNRWNHVCAESGCLFAGPWHDMVIRSGLTLKLMSNRFAGSLAESVTTSIPAILGGSRNWDYRYAWIRHAGQAIQALTGLGHDQEGSSLFRWLSDVVTRDGAEGLQSVYTLDGGKYLPEHELNLMGYGGSRPVRVGNLSARQFHLDIYGCVMTAMAQNLTSQGPDGRLPGGLWPKLAEIAEYVCQAWRRPDKGMWEVRTKPEHFVSSKVMCWVALDRAIWIAHRLGQEVPRRWREEREILHRTILEQGYDSSRGSFVRAFGDRELDAAVLLIPMVGFLPPDDPRVHSTLDAIQAELGDAVLIHASRSTDSIREADGAHLLSSFRYVSCLAMCGRVDEASDRLAELCSFASPLGLFAEQVDPLTGVPAGNFPSSSAHLSLINASLYVGAARGRKVPKLELGLGLGLTTALSSGIRSARKSPRVVP